MSQNLPQNVSNYTKKSFKTRMWKNSEKVTPKSPKIAIWGAILGASWSADSAGGGSFCDLVFGTCSGGTLGSILTVFFMDLGAMFAIFGVILGSMFDKSTILGALGASKPIQSFYAFWPAQFCLLLPISCNACWHPSSALWFHIVLQITFGLACWHSCSMLFIFFVMFFVVVPFPPKLESRGLLK